VKCNVGPRQGSIAYRIEPRTLTTRNGPVETSIAIRAGHANASAGDLLGNVTSATEATARSEARDFLEAELSAGPVPTLTLKDRSHDAGLSWPTVERAKKQLGIRARKNGTSWQWELPNSPLDGVDVVDGGVGGKAIKAINSVTENGHMRSSMRTRPNGSKPSSLTSARRRHEPARATRLPVASLVVPE